MDHSKAKASALTGEFVCNPAEPTEDAQTFSGKTFAYYVKTTGNMTSWSQKAAETYTIDYDVKTTSTTFTIYVGNTSSNTPQLSYAVYDEKSSAHSSPDVALTAIGDAIPSGKTTAQYTTRTVTITRSTNARVSFVTSKYSDTKIYQIVANETGTPLPKVGEAGYTLNLNKGRFALNASYKGKIDGNLEIQANGAYNMANGSNVSIANGKVSSQYFKFTTPATPGKLKLTYSGSGSQMAYNLSASSDEAINITSGTEYALSGSTTYYLINTGTAAASVTKIEFVVPTYSVTYEENGHGETQTDLTEQTNLPDPLPTLSETGWTFGGWFTDNNTFNTPAVAGAALTADATLYAKWTIKSHTLTWTLGEDASITSTPGTYTAAGSVNYGTNLVAPTVERSGYDFIGWDPEVPATMPDADVTCVAQWAVHCDASAPGEISKGAASGGTGIITLTAEGEAVDGDTWYWQDAADGTDKTNSGSTLDVDEAGTYYIRSYNTADDCWSGIVESITIAAEDLLTAINPSLSYGSQVIIGNTLSPTLTGNAGSGDVSYALNNVTPAGCMTINAETGVVTAVAAGTATVTATIAANGNYKSGSATSGTVKVIRDPVGTNHTLTWTVRVNNSETTITTTDKEPSSIYTGSMTNIAINGALSVDNTGKNSGTGKITPTSGEKVAANCLSMTFAIEDGYTFTPTNYTMSTTAVSTSKTVEVEISDTHGHSKSATWAQPKTSSTPDSHNYDLSGSAYEGVVTLKIYVYNDKNDQEESVNNGYRLGSPIVLTGTISEKHAITIDDAVENGSVDANAGTAIVGTEITLSNEAASGYKLRAYDVYKTGDAETKVTVTAGKFTMPDYPVTVSGVFAELYDVTCATGLENGSVSADKAKAISGEEVIITATPESGFQLVAIKVVETADPENDITATALSGTTLTMPGYGVTVSATFSKATALNDVENEVKAVKVLRNGQLFIEKAGKTYNAQGQIIK